MLRISSRRSLDLVQVSRQGISHHRLHYYRNRNYATTTTTTTTIRQSWKLQRQRRQPQPIVVNKTSTISSSSSTSSNSNRLHHFQVPRISSFRTLQSRYLSNAAAAAVTSSMDEYQDDDHDDKNSENDTHSSSATSPTTTAATVAPRRMVPPWLKYYYYNFDPNLSLSDVRNAFDVQALRNFQPRSGSATLSQSQVVPWHVTCLWTASFTCPVTKQVFEAGPVGEEEEDSCFDTTTTTTTRDKEDDAIPFFIDGRYYFTTKKAAVHAAAVQCAKDKDVDISMISTPSTTTTTTDDRETVWNDGSHNTSSTKSPFPSSIDNPRSQLQDSYRQHRVFPSASENFQYIKHNFVGGGSGKGGTWWTASFQCPVSQKWYGAVDLPQVAPELKMKCAGRWWYRQKPNGMHAASMNALETIAWDELAKDVEERMELRNGHSQLVLRLHMAQKRFELEANIQPILYWYRQHHDMDLASDADGTSVEDFFVSTESSFSRRGDRWTASFLCPVTGERFDAGTLNDVASDRLEGYSWYKTKSAAIQAAALSAYDTLQYRKNGQSGPRFCKEDPSSRVASIVEGSIDRHEPTIANSDEQATLQFNGRIEEHSKDEETVESIVDDDDDDDDEYFIEIIPQQASFTEGRQASALDVIAETWIESTRSATAAEDVGGRIDNTYLAVKQRQEAIDRAKEWLKQQSMHPTQPSTNDRTHFLSGGEMSKLTIANVILSSLAETHQHVTFDSSPVGVEDIAERILESMWSSNMYTPDSTSYASYLKCLEGKSTEEVAARAQEIVNAMKCGAHVNGRLLPAPNHAVYASLYQILAQTGQMNLALSSENFPVTRIMFLSKMSAMAHNPGTFDIDMAKQYIDCMREMYEKTSDVSLIPDIEAYNAPLRWSGGGTWSRSFSRAISWDSYHVIFSNGFLPCDSASSKCLHDQARTMANWLKFIQTHSEVSPDIQTIESVIQAWVRCGTGTGMQEAERLAEAVLNNEFAGVEPRLQTYYPVLAGWAYSGSQEGPEKVGVWLESLRDVFKDLETRRRFVAAPFISQLSLQRQAPAGSEGLAAASACSVQLKELVHSYTTLPSFFLPHDVFLLTSQAWGKVASMTETMDDLDRCLDAMEETNELFEEVVVWLDQNRCDETNSQLVHLLNQAPSLYGAQLTWLRDYSRLSGSLDKSCDSTKHVLAVEEKVRRSYEFVRYLEDISDYETSGKYDFGDSIVLHSESLLENPVCRTWSDYMSKAVSVIQAIVEEKLLTFESPDLVRLCHVISNGIKVPATSHHEMIASFSRMADANRVTDNAAIADALKILREAIENHRHQHQHQQQGISGPPDKLVGISPQNDSEKFKSGPRAIEELPASVQNKIKHLKYISYIEGELDEGILGMLGDLSEPAAYQLLERFQIKMDSQTAVNNKTAFLAGMLWRECCDSSSPKQDTKRRSSDRIRRRKSPRATGRGLSAKSKRRPRPHRSKMSGS